MSDMIWYAGKDNYKKLELELLVNPNHDWPELGGDFNHFTLTLLDKPTHNFQNINQSFAYSLEGANLPVEVLYSGGIDSECVLVSCLQNKIPAIAITMRLMFRGAPINTHDLYYSEKFCRERNIPQRIVDLDIEKFFTNGDHKKYLEPYYLRLNNVATHMWLIEQCDRFPVIGGDYSWPLLEDETRMYSPHRNEYQFYDIFMQDNGITGIGNMMNHCIESNIFFIKEHVKLFEEDPKNIGGDLLRIKTLKIRLMERLGFGKFEDRHKSYGWEMLEHYKKWFDVIPYNKEFLQKYNYTENTIVWESMLGQALGIDAGRNYNYYGYKFDLTGNFQKNG